VTSAAPPRGRYWDILLGIRSTGIAISQQTEN
jgi:hypothetical protein